MNGKETEEDTLILKKRAVTLWKDMVNNFSCLLLGKKKKAAAKAT